MPLTQATLKVCVLPPPPPHPFSCEHSVILPTARNAIYETTWEGDNDTGMSVAQDELMLRDFTFVNVQNLVEANNDIINSNHHGSASEKGKPNALWPKNEEVSTAAGESPKQKTVSSSSSFFSFFK